MRKHSKKLTAVIAGTAAAVVVSGVAYAYWTTSGSGSGSGSTTAGGAVLTFTQNPAGEADTPVALNAMYPGDSSQALTIRVRNTSATESAYVPSVKAWIETNKPGCDATDFKLNGSPSTAVDADHAADLTWTAQDLAKGAAANATGSVQFYNKSTNQDACKGATVTMHYFVPVTPLPTSSATP